MGKKIPLKYWEFTGLKEQQRGIKILIGCQQFFYRI